MKYILICTLSALMYSCVPLQFNTKSNSYLYPPSKAKEKIVDAWIKDGGVYDSLVVRTTRMTTISAIPFSNDIHFTIRGKEVDILFLENKQWSKKISYNVTTARWSGLKNLH